MQPFSSHLRPNKVFINSADSVLAVTRVTEILFPSSGSGKKQINKTFATLINQKLHWRRWTLKTGHVFLCDLGEPNPRYRHFFLSPLLRKKESAGSHKKKSQIHRGGVTKENIPALRSISVFLQLYFNWLILGLKYQKVWHSLPGFDSWDTYTLSNLLHFSSPSQIPCVKNAQISVT